MADKPLDILNHAKGKNVTIYLKDERVVTGILIAFDIHLNIGLEDAEITYDKKKKAVPMLLVRGDNILYIEGVK
ncbi:MAG: small nuclear ribonucleoprotein [Euryarchaeota archaeon HGW-Euryarchaeota-1]|nr:MAG: small nuclear ribonucleoprotein [Euryarchaeota archaeon HGW-Euryarchaeota-1]